MKVELSTPSQSSLTPEVQQKLELFDNIQKQVEQNQIQQKSYADNIAKASAKMEKMQLNLADDVSIDFNISEQDRKSIPSFIENMPHWRNEDGSWNHENVVKDAVKIRNFDKMLKIAFEQGKNSGKDEIVKDTKNVNMKPQEAGPQEGKKGPRYEGIDDMLAKRTLKIRR